MRRAALAASFLLLTIAPILSAATFNRVTDAQLVDRADLIVVAHVESATSRELDRSIVTEYKLRVEEVLRGQTSEATVTVRELGGTANGLIMIVPGSASYEPGSRVVAFLRRHTDGTYSTAAMAFGAFRFSRDGNVLTRDDDGIEANSPDDLAPRSAKELIDFARGASTVAPRPLSIELNEFEPRPDASAPSAYVTKGGPTGNIKPVRWPGCHVDCTISFKINGVQAVSDSAGGVGAAMAAWTNDPNSFMKLQLSGLTANATATNSNGENQVLLNNSSPAPSNLSECDAALACGIAWATTSSHTFQGESFYNAFEADVLFRPGAFSQNAFEAIMAHELGHGLAFRHANTGTPSSSAAIMSSPTPTSQGATLRAWDQEAAAVVYGNGVACVGPAVSSVSGGGTVGYGNRTTLIATVTGSTPFTYQWYEGTFPDTNTPVGSNQTSYQTVPITVEHKYWVKVTNDCGTANSTTITVTPTECTRPQITTQPQSVRIDPNATATLTVAATGTSPLTYAWYEGNRGDTSKKVGTNATSFKTPNLTATTIYWVKVSNACGDVNSDEAVVSVGTQCVKPNIALQPLDATVNVGSKGLLHVAAAGDAPIAFQWYEGDSGNETTPIAGATSAVYEPGPFTASGAFKFWAKATNACGSANSNTATITVNCVAVAAPAIFSPPVAPSALGYSISWSGVLTSTPNFELQEATNPDFVGAKTFAVANATKFAIPAHTEITSDTRFYYRVRAFSACNQQPSAFSPATSTFVIAPLPQNSTDFVIGLPEGTTQTFVQNYLVPGFGATATNSDTFTITSEVPWMTVFPSSGALSAGGTTVQISINPVGLGVGSTTGTLSVQRFNGTAGRIGTDGNTTTTTIPFSISLVTPVSPAPRDTQPPAGTLLIPAIAHADGIGTRFQSDVRIANAASEPITYEISFTPSGSDGTSTGKKTTMVINANETRGLDDVVKIWFGAGAGGELGLGTLEIRPTKLASGGIPNAQSTFASSRTYSIGTTGTLGQFIPALPLSGFIGNIAADALARISLQQISHNERYRTNIGFAEGSGAPVDIVVRLRDAGGALLKSVPFSLSPYEHRHLSFGQVFGNDATLGDGRVEVEVTSTNGKVTAYASVLDNDTTDPLLVFPVQARKLSATNYVVPGVAELNAGSNFHTDMRLYNPTSSPIAVTLSYKPQRGDSTPVPAAVTRTVNAGQVLAIDNVLPTLWNLNASGGAVTASTPNPTSLVVTARTFSREADGGTFGQFIPAVTTTDAVGLGDRALEILQLEDSGDRSQKTGFRSNLGLVEVTGNRAVVEITLRPPDSKFTAVQTLELQGGEFVQLPQIFRFFGFTNVYNGRVSFRVIDGLGRVAGYGSVVDNRTEDPTYVPSQ